MPLLTISVKLKLLQGCDGKMKSRKHRVLFFWINHGSGKASTGIYRTDFHHICLTTDSGIVLEVCNVRQNNGCSMVVQAIHHDSIGHRTQPSELPLG